MKKKKKLTEDEELVEIEEELVRWREEEILCELE